MLRLVHDNEPTDGPATDATEGRHPLKFERRRVPRYQQNGPVTVFYSGSTGDSARFGLLSLEVVDASPAGICCRTPRLIEPGMRIGVCPPGMPAAYRTGVVVRAREENGQYVVGVRYDYAAAARVRGA